MLPSEPEGLLAARLVERAEAAPLVFVARGEARAARLHRAAAALAPGAMRVALLPGWDCLPYDRVSPSAAVMGQRLALPAGDPPRLLVLSMDAALQRLPRQVPALRLRQGDALDAGALLRRLAAFGYRLDELVDEPGEVAARGATLDLFPAEADHAWRLRLEEGRIAAIEPYDPSTQRSGGGPVPGLTLRPASELVLAEDHPLAAARPPGLEHLLPAFAEDLVAPLALLPDAAVVLDEGAEEARARRIADVAEAFRLRLATATPRPGLPPLPPPAALHLNEEAWAASLGGRAPGAVGPATEAAVGAARQAATPRFAAEPDPDAALAGFVEGARAAGRRVAIAGGIGHGARRLVARLGGEAAILDGWPALLRAKPGTLALLRDAPGDEGFATRDAAVLPYGAIRGTAGAPRDAAPLAPAAPMLQPGDAVIHLDHGLGALAGVEPVAAGDATVDCLRLDYAAGQSRLVPFDELDRIWRYGAEAGSVTLDRLDGGGWAKRRAEAEAAAEETAHRLVALLREREARRAPALRPPAGAMRRFAAGFPYDPTPDQAGAIAATLGDLARPHPMDRLVCGDVGFGKTEVALRAAAAAALAGRQVAVLAPTTVLVRQHLDVFRRRFAPFGIAVAALSRLTPAAEARAIRADLAGGALRIVLGTTALAAKGVRFRDLALVVVDEEHRFGAREKAALARLQAGGREEAPHLLTLTATPIPRTLAASLIGLRELSVVATPPARRQPVRTLRGAIADDVLVQALRREARRGGQSFLVCPRVEDLAPMRERLAALVPELAVVVAHGAMKPAEMDEAVVRFAEGEGDVLLSTSIVESGLDVPRANTMLVCGAEGFGLAQLHQLRGRVGRGRSRGVFWLLTEAGRALPAPTERRLAALAALDRIGAGFALSARDLDLRGAGELLGEAQAGHLRLVGIELHRHLLGRALATARGEAPAEEWSPALALGVDAHVPPDHVAEPALRVELHARLGALLREGDAAALDALEEEAEDRFGPSPEPLQNLFALARLSLRCRKLGIARLEAGPAAVAATPRGRDAATPRGRDAATPRGRDAAMPAMAAPEGLVAKGGRLLLPRPGPDGAARLAGAAALLDLLEPRRRRAA
ncbi:DEAD/DEAH box helicase [Falsiroseomonas sp. CW058]|uniref:DEAD/DEAH box helicase n=1 Tax=Falsiroseomonas sp. CW058 TaxID=3388664 RepID=UPI003D3234E4